MEVFFLIESGTIGVAAVEAGATEGFGVASVLPVGKNGCRLLRGSPEGRVTWGGRRMGCSSRVTSPSIEQISMGREGGGDLNGGRGDGLRGPIGRRSWECCDIEREGRIGDSIALVGVHDSGRDVVDF